jgi:uncharacterized membrane protein YdjX (TVP38/TMEM64 family)
MARVQRHSRWHSRRLVVLGVLVALATALLLAKPAHAWLLSLFGTVEQLIRHRPAWGMLAFVILAAVSAMLAFVSSAILIPAAVYVWGTELCFLLLWAGWLLGGVAAYTIGRYLGRPAVQALVPSGALERYESWATSGVSFVSALFLQLAVPSDVAGYLFGLVRCRFPVYLAALALAEIPYALGAVYLGESFLERRLWPLLGVGVVGALLSVWALRTLRGRFLAPARVAGVVGPEDAKLITEQRAREG